MTIEEFRKQIIREKDKYYTLKVLDLREYIIQLVIPEEYNSANIQCGIFNDLRITTATKEDTFYILSNVHTNFIRFTNDINKANVCIGLYETLSRILTYIEAYSASRNALYRVADKPAIIFLKPVEVVVNDDKSITVLKNSTIINTTNKFKDRTWKN
jgi:hypothetical protein